jgi:moderate conductance mechanosensitive channel
MIPIDSLLVAKGVHLRQDWGDVFNLPELTSRGLKVLGALFVGWLAYWGLKLVLRRIERGLGEPDPAAYSVHEQRARTLVGLVRSIGMVVIFILMLFMVLGALGVDVGPLLAGAGVVGLAVSFGAQSLVKDIISGLFILFENQFGVGDVIRLDTHVSGAVERMTLRVVVLRDVHGVVHIVPNGEIKRVSNLTRTWSRAVLDLGVSYRADVDRVMEVLLDVGREMGEDPQWGPLLLEPITVPGVQDFTDSAVVIRLLAKTLPLKQWDVARELRRRIKRRFDAEGIEIPFPQRMLHVADGGASPALSALAPAHAPQPAAAARHGDGPRDHETDDDSAREAM